MEGEGGSDLKSKKLFAGLINITCYSDEFIKALRGVVLVSSALQSMG